MPADKEAPMTNEIERAEGSLTDGGSLPGRKGPRRFGGERARAAKAAAPGKGGRLPGEADLSTQRGKDLPDGGYAAPSGNGRAARGYGG
jgi:hypothetical protein